VKHPDAKNEIDMHVRITTSDEAVRWCEKLAEHVEAARTESIFATTIPDARTAYGVFVLRQGSALGTMLALLRTGFLSATQYDALKARVLATNITAKQQGG
jgi:hypothetical protein